MGQHLERIDRARTLIGKAAQAESVDVALAMLMAEAGVTEGDVAGQFFSTFEDSQEHWNGLENDERAKLLSQYLDTEAVYAASVAPKRH